MRKILIFIFCFLVFGKAVAQNTAADSHQKTSSPTNARYEIVQSELAAKWTFRLDRFTGKVWQLVSDSDKNFTWEEMKIFELPNIQNPHSPRFQIFTSGLAARFTFLLDCSSGKTWVLSNSNDLLDNKDVESVEWSPFN